MFGGEDGDYRTLYILPALATRRYHFEVFPRLDKAHEPRRRAADAVLATLVPAGAKADLEAAIDGHKGWSRQELRFSASRGFEPLESDTPGGPGPTVAADPMEDRIRSRMEDEQSKGDTVWERLEKGVFSKTPRGQVFRQLVELDASFGIVRWTGWVDEAKRIRKVEMVSVPKVGAHDFLWREVRNVPVWITDAELRDNFRNKVSWEKHVSWVRPSHGS